MKLWTNSNGTLVEFIDEHKMVWVTEQQAYAYNDEQWHELDTNDISSYAKWCKANGKEAKFIGNLNDYTSKVYER